VAHFSISKYYCMSVLHMRNTDCKLLIFKKYVTTSKIVSATLEHLETHSKDMKHSVQKLSSKMRFLWIFRILVIFSKE